MLKQKEAKYEKTSFYHKKKESLSVGSAVKRGGSDAAITGFSRDTVPAGIRATNASQVTIYGSGFGAVKGNIFMEDANKSNMYNFVALHPTHNILYWSDDSIQIVVPSMGFASPDEFVGDTRNACAGTGYIRVIPGTGLPIPIWSETELVVPHAIAITPKIPMMKTFTPLTNFAYAMPMGRAATPLCTIPRFTRRARFGSIPKGIKNMALCHRHTFQRIMRRKRFL